MEKNERNFILTDAMSLKEISPAVYDADIKYKRIVGPEAIKAFIEDNKENLSCKIKRKGYAYGLSKLTGYTFETVEDSMVDVPFGGAVINIGTANSTRVNLNDEENWDQGYLDLELRVMYADKIQG